MNVHAFDTKQYSHGKVFELAQSAEQYEAINTHIASLLAIHSDFLLSQFMADISEMMTLENNAGWDEDAKHSKKIDLLFELQNKWQPETDRFLS
jgi:hypothetical protein